MAIPHPADDLEQAHSSFLHRHELVLSLSCRAASRMSFEELPIDMPSEYHGAVKEEGHDGANRGGYFRGAVCLVQRS
jgi:hypothetical protein